MSAFQSAAPAGAPETGREAKKPIWYRRRSLLVALLVVAVLVVTVLIDLPEHADRQAQISSDSLVVREAITDVGPCAYAVNEVFTIYRDKLSSRLSSSDSARVPGLLRDDQAACSFTDQSIYDLSSIEVPGSVAGKHLQDLVSTLTLWTTADALAAIEAVQTLVVHPADRAARRRLAVAEVELRRDRLQANAEIAAADDVLSARLPALNLPVSLRT